MKVFKTLIQILGIYLISFIGEWIHQLLHLPIPGSIIGMLLLFILLSTKILPESWIELGANFFLKYMALFFIPATVGVMNYFSIFQGKGLLLVIALIISTCLVIISAGLVSEKMGSRIMKKENHAA